MAPPRIGIFGAPDRWEVTLRSGGVIVVYAHSYSVIDGALEFFLMLDKKPVGDLRILSIPEVEVAHVYSAP